MRSPILSTKEFYHVYNRGVNKRNIFQNVKDYKRFLTALSLLNTNSHSIHALNGSKSHQQNEDDKLVNILAFCLMPNHFHLFLEQRAHDGISKFMHKICMSHAKYFNYYYKRSGALFEPKFKSKHIDNQAYYSQISKYIHRNPLDLFRGDDEKAKRDFLLSYQWSSLGEYIKPRRDNFIDRRVMDDFGNA